MRRAKVDVNQPEIVAAFRKLGWSVQHLHMVGQGCPDILVGKWGVSYPIEIKDGSLPPSARKLTGPEEKWHSEWKGSVFIVSSVEDVLKIDKELAVTSCQTRLER